MSGFGEMKVKSRMNRNLPRLLGLALASLALVASQVRAQAVAEANNVVLVGHDDLNGNGDGGEGLAIQQRSDGRRILYLAHEGQKTCLSIVDVTHPDRPVF